MAKSIVCSHESKLPSLSGDLDVFGRIAARHYDEDARRIGGRYRLAHTIQNKLISLVLSQSAAGRPMVVDLGCGTGADACSLLSSVARAFYLGVDSSAAMLEQAKTNMQRRGLLRRSVFVQSDFRTVTPEGMLSAIETIRPKPEVCCVMSTLALHHYALREKQAIYDVIRALLKKGGLLVITDLFANSLSCCSEMALERELRDVRMAIAKRSRRRADIQSYPTTLSEQHYVEENRPEVLMDEIAVIQRCGFKNVDIIFRTGQLAIISAGD